jgi:hypothetical protein
MLSFKVIIAMVDGIFEDCNVDLIEVALWCGGERFALEDKGQPSFSKFSAIMNKPTGRCSPNEETTSLYN